MKMTRYSILTVILMIVLCVLIYSFLPASKEPTVIWDKGERFSFGPKQIYGQGSQTIYTTALDGVTTYQASSAVTNIGQSNHLLSVKAINGPGGVCPNDFGWYVAIEGSFDGTIYKSIGPPITSLVQINTSPNTLTGQTYAYGAYPYVRINFASGHQNICRVSAYYTGTLPSTVTQSFVAGGAGNYISLYGVVNNGVVDVTSVTNTGTSGKVVLYGQAMTNVANALSTITFTESTSGRVVGQYSIGPYMNLTLPPTSIPYFTSIISGSKIQGTVTEAGQTVNVLSIYRLE